MARTIGTIQTYGYTLGTDPLTITSAGGIEPVTGPAISASGAGTIVNAGIVLGDGLSAGIYVAGSAFITNSGTVSGGALGIFAGNLGSSGLVSNTGLISGTGITGIGVNLGTGSTLVNDGTVSGAGIYGAIFPDGGTLTNGTNQSTARLFGNETAVEFKLGAGSVTNYGTIIAQPAGNAPLPRLPGAVALGDGGNVANGAPGHSAALISGWKDGVSIENASATITNFGTITGAVVGVAFDGAGGEVINAGTIGGTTAAVDFGLAGNNVLVIEPGSVLTGGIADFVAGDEISLPGLSETLAGYGGGVLNLAGDQSITLTLGGDFTAGELRAISDGSGGTDIVIACFAAGTRILTARGEVAVEALALGDAVVTLHGRRLAPIVWLGHRRVDCARHPAPDTVWPYRVAAGAFGPGMPARELWLSPDHAVFVDGALVPIRLLANGASIAQVAVAAVTYWHVELAAHDVLLAEGLPAESYLDTGNRDAFAEATAIALHPVFAPDSSHAGHGCAALLLEGDRLAGIRETLIARAEHLGWRRGAADLVLLADGRMVPATGTAEGLEWHLPAGTRTGLLLSRRFQPCWWGVADGRVLGVAVASLALDGAPPTEARFGAGWHPAEPRAAWRWTDGAARLDVAGARRLSLRLVEIGAYWDDATSSASRGPAARSSTAEKP